MSVIRGRRARSLTAGRRRALKSSQFALPGRRYPIDTPGRARNALARVAQNGSPHEKRVVRMKVHRRYPGIHVSGM